MTPELMISRRLFTLFLLGCLLFNYPILSLFNLNAFLFGIPLLYFYMFAVWTVLIVIIVFVTRPREKTRSAAGRRRKSPEL
ncbi:MAG: hypothetical protein WBV21_20760 [Desulfobacterales bacterium]